MGSWGVKLYQDDLALDIKERFNDLVRSGKSAEEITMQFIEEYADVLSDAEEETVFWCALADTQWNMGMLMSDVKMHAIKLIDNGMDVLKWSEESSKLACDRKAVLDELREKLNTPCPNKKTIRQARLYKCEWNIGDVFALRMESDFAAQHGLKGQYFLFQKVDEAVWHPGHIIPIVYVKITNAETLPCSLSEFDQLKYVQTSYSVFDPILREEFRPEGQALSKEEYLCKLEEKKAEYEFDEHGLLPEFRIKIIITSKKSIPSTLRFLGNFQNSRRPQKEFIPKNKTEIPAFYWSKFGKTIEEKLLEAYFEYTS